MRLKNLSEFYVSGLNQEKWLNQLCQQFALSEIRRESKTETRFKCSYFSHKKVEKFLKNHGVKIESITHDGPAHKAKKLLTSYGLVAAILLCGGLYIFQNQFVLQYEVLGLDRLSADEIVGFVSQNYSKQKSKIDTQEIESGLIKHFERISFASCIIKGQTLVINIKEKLLPQEMYGDFPPLVATKNARITQISLVSGTLQVQVGDIVRAGDVLVAPFVVDSVGNIKKVEAKADILAEVYSVGSSEHYDTYIEVKRTGRKIQQDEVLLFGLTIYKFQQNVDFKMFETETEEVPLVKNLFLPFKLRKTTYFELEENRIESKFEDVEEEFVAKAKKNALENCERYDKMKEEFYTLRHLQGMTIVNFCIITEENICGV